MAVVVLTGVVQMYDILLAPGACRPGSTQVGCADIAVGDADEDGTPDYLDHCPDDALNTCAPGVPTVPDAQHHCGSGHQDRDADGVCMLDCSHVSCDSDEVCDDATGIALCVCAPGNGCEPDETELTLLFNASPSNAVAGERLTLVSVKLVDASAELVVGAPNPVTLALESAGGATLSGTLTATPTDGVATFSDLVIEKAGTGYTLVATSEDLAPVTSASFESTHASDRTSAAADGIETLTSVPVFVP